MSSDKEVSNEIKDLSTDEIEILQNTMPTLEDKSFQLKIVTALFTISPEIEDCFETFGLREQRGVFLLNMIKKGTNMTINKEYTELIELFSRHPTYNVTEQHINKTYKIIIDQFKQHDFNQQNNETMTIIDAWQRSAEIISQCAQMGFLKAENIKKDQKNS